MSYILDALRKADSERERERGAVPDLHAQPAPANTAVAPDDEGRSGPPMLVWAVVGLSGLVLVLLGWMFLGRDAAAPVATSATPAAPLPQPMQQPVPPTMVAPQPQPVQPPAPALPPVAPPMAAPLPPPTARIDPPPERSAALAVPSPAAVPAVPAVVARPTSVQPAPVAATPAAPVATAVRAESRVWSVDELPDDVRRQLPNLMVNGSKYSETPASRILIIGGQVFHEGDRLTSELTLEQIQLKEAVLRFRGYRYALKF